MRALAEAQIRDTATLCGLAPDKVMRRAETPSRLDPARRMELEFLPESYTRAPKRVGKWTTGVHRRIRSQVYRVRLPVRAVVYGDDEGWLAGFVREFIGALPNRMADSDGNLVRIRVEQAVRGGYVRKPVEVFVERNVGLHLVFEWMLCRDADLPLIRAVDVKSGITIT